MTELKLSKVAQEYYEGLRAKSIVQGWEKYVATDGEQCLFVKSEYDPKPGEAVFFIATRMRNTSVQLWKGNL